MGFDFDHTLGIDNKLERVAFLQLLSGACEEGGRCIGTLAEEIGRIDALLADQRRGHFTIERAVERFMHERGIRNAAPWVDQYKRTCVDMVRTFVIPEPGVRETLWALRERGVRSAILTNGWAPLQQYKAQQVGFEGPVLVSADLGVQKPEPAAFRALAEALGTSPERIAFVGDTPASDVAGATAAGMQAVWFDAEGLSYPSELPGPAYTIRALTELLSLV